jgi:hypothetical protein
MLHGNAGIHAPPSDSGGVREHTDVVSLKAGRTATLAITATAPGTTGATRTLKLAFTRR